MLTITPGRRLAAVGATICIMLGVLAVCGCTPPAATGGPVTSLPPGTPSYPAIVGMVQTDYPLLTAALAVVAPGNKAVTAAEAVIGPLVAGLTPTTAPLTLKAVLTPLAALLPNVPTCAAGVTAQTGCLTTQTKSDITLGLALAGAV